MSWEILVHELVVIMILWQTSLENKASENYVL